MIIIKWKNKKFKQLLVNSMEYYSKFQNGII
jgi:hypothetical protein